MYGVVCSNVCTYHLVIIGQKAQKDSLSRPLHPARVQPCCIAKEWPFKTIIVWENSAQWPAAKTILEPLYSALDLLDHLDLVSGSCDHPIDHLSRLSS